MTKEAKEAIYCFYLTIIKITRTSKRLAKQNGDAIKIYNLYYLFGHIFWYITCIGNYYLI